MIIIFLDIDGVLLDAKHRLAGNQRISLFDTFSVFFLNSLIIDIEKTEEVGIVISSDWRQGYPIPQLKELLQQHAFSRKIIDKTSEKATDDEVDVTRGARIKTWLEEHQTWNISNFVIFDDHPFDILDHFSANFVHCTDGVLSAQDLESAVTILNTRSAPVDSFDPRKVIPVFQIDPAIKKTPDLAEHLLRFVANGQQAAAEALLRFHPRLLFKKGSVQDYSGRIIYGTAFQIALGAEDADMCEMMAPYFHCLPGGEAALLEQYQEQFPDGYETKEKIQNDLEALNKIFQAISVSTTDQDCEEAFKNFREYLEPKFPITQGKHFNTELLAAAFKIYEENYTTFSSDGHRRNILFFSKTIGYIQRFLPACYAQALCQGLYHVIARKQELRRHFKSSFDNVLFFPLDSSPEFRLGYETAVFWCWLPSETSFDSICFDELLISYIKQKQQRCDALVNLQEMNLSIASSSKKATSSASNSHFSTSENSNTSSAASNSISPAESNLNVFSLFTNQKKKSATQHWYLDDEMNILIAHYLGKQPGIEILCGINAFENNGLTLIEALKDNLLQQVLRESAGDPIHTLVMPLNLGNLHWAALYLRFGENKAQPLIGYFDPLGMLMPVEIPEALSAVYPSVNWETDMMTTDIRLQNDAYNCGPWTIAILENLALYQQLPPEDFDVQQRRREDADFMREYFANLSRGTLLLSMSNRDRGS